MITFESLLHDQQFPFIHGFLYTLSHLVLIPIWKTDNLPIFYVGPLRFREGRWMSLGHTALPIFYVGLNGDSDSSSRTQSPCSSPRLVLFMAWNQCWGNSAQQLWWAEWIAFIICQHVIEKNQNNQKIKTPGSSRFPINHLKFVWITYYLNIWQ